MSPQRIQLKRTKGWRKPEGAIVVSRPSRWGNPYVLRWADCSMPAGTMCWQVREGDRLVKDHFNDRYAAAEHAVACYWMWASRSPRLWEIQRDLAGRDLACWCALDQPCHADVLLGIANPPAGSSGTEQQT